MQINHASSVPEYLATDINLRRLNTMIGLVDVAYDLEDCIDQFKRLDLDYRKMGIDSAINWGISEDETTLFIRVDELVLIVVTED